MIIKEVTKSDIAGIAKVHVDSWRSTYRGILPDEFLNGLSYRQSEEHLEQVFEDKNRFCFVVEDDFGHIIAGGPERNG